MKQLKAKKRPKQLTLRLPASLHTALQKEAASEGASLNQYCVYILSKGMKTKDWEEFV